MKAWAIIVTIFLILSLCLNGWYYSETSKLNAKVSSELGYGYGSDYELPPQTMAQLQSNFGRVMELSRQLKSDYERLEEHVSSLTQETQQLRQQKLRCEADLLHIKQEAERAEELGVFTSLLRLIFSLI